MSSNLVELIRRHHGPIAHTALQVLKEAVDSHGEVTDEDRLRAAEASGLPVASVYGVSTFYDDLLQPRGAPSREGLHRYRLLRGGRRSPRE